MRHPWRPSTNRLLSVIANTGLEGCIDSGVFQAEALETDTEIYLKAPPNQTGAFLFGGRRDKSPTGEQGSKTVDE